MKKILLILLVCIAIKANGQNTTDLKVKFKGEGKVSFSEEVYQNFKQVVKEQSSSKTLAGKKLIEELVLFWNNNGWNDTIHKTEYEIDEMDRLVTWYHYIYDFGKFEYFRKIDYSYDQAGNKIGAEIQGYNSATSSWYQFSRETFIYDTYNNITESKLELYFSGQWNVEFINSWQYKYNTNGKITEKIETVQYRNSSVNFVEKEEVLYDASGKDSMYIYYNYDTTMTAWVPFERILEVKWSGNKITGAEFQFYTNGIWENSNKVEISYDTLGREISNVGYMWDEANLVWENLTKNTFSYFPNGDQDTIALYQWVSGDWLLADGEKFTYTYNATNELISLERQIYEINLQSWVKTLKFIYNYSTISGTNIVALSNPEIIAYPNPVKDQLIISGLGSNENKIMIFDMNGRFIAGHTSSGSEAKIDMTHLQNGSYIIQVKEKDISTIMKVIKN